MNSKTQITIGNVFSTTFAQLFTPLTVFLWVACWTLAVLAGPFGTYEAMNLWVRVAYWGGLSTLGVLIGFATHASGVWLLGREERRLFPIVAACVMTVLYAPLVIGLRTYFSLYTEGLAIYPVSITINVFLITFGVFMFRQFMWLDSAETGIVSQSPVEKYPSGEEVMLPRLMRRLPVDIQGGVIRLEAKNHHVEVTTENGTVALRMRLVDAISEMEPIEGMCVHRSHWVTCDAIEEVIKINAHKTVVHLINGDTIPVSRKYRTDLENAGWMEFSKAG